MEAGEMLAALESVAALHESQILDWRVGGSGSSNVAEAPATSGMSAEGKAGAHGHAGMGRSQHAMRDADGSEGSNSDAASARMPSRQYEYIPSPPRPRLPSESDSQNEIPGQAVEDRVEALIRENQQLRAQYNKLLGKYEVKKRLMGRQHDIILKYRRKFIRFFEDVGTDVPMVDLVMSSDSEGEGEGENGDRREYDFGYHPTLPLPPGGPSAKRKTPPPDGTDASASSAGEERPWWRVPVLPGGPSQASSSLAQARRAPIPPPPWAGSIDPQAQLPPLDPQAQLPSLPSELLELLEHPANRRVRATVGSEPVPSTSVMATSGQKRRRSESHSAPQSAAGSEADEGDDGEEEEEEEEEGEEEEEEGEEDAAPEGNMGVASGVGSSQRPSLHKFAYAAPASSARDRSAGASSRQESSGNYTSSHGLGVRSSARKFGLPLKNEPRIKIKKTKRPGQSWTEEEDANFMETYMQFGKKWKDIRDTLETDFGIKRTREQVQTHGQYLIKMGRIPDKQ